MKPSQQRIAYLKRRGGAALIIVLAMTGMLMFLGFFFFSFISAERNSAAWFALSPNRQINDGDYFDFALQQILIGPTDDLKNSALYGRKWSLIPNMVGSFGPDLKPKDLHVYSGRGINVTFSADSEGVPNDSALTNSQFNFDYENNGSGSDTNDRKILNFSPAANPMGSGVPFTPLGQQRHTTYVPDFEPDAGYTYPDINSMFLGHFSVIYDRNDAVSPLKKVWIPSFHRPQYLPRTATADLYTNSVYRNRVLRPHRESRVQLREWDGSSVIPLNNRRRYVDIGGFDAVTGTVGPTAGFPFPTDHHSGIWQNETEWNNIQYDIDADGITANGNEAILLDLDYRPEVLPDGTRRIPMVAITIMDGDGLLNLNAAGNLYGETTSLVHGRTGGSTGVDQNAFGDGRFITHSNLGLSPGELNLGRALYRPLPGGGGTTVPPTGSLYEDMFRYDAATAQVTQVDMANLEVARLLLGVADGNVATTTDVVAGRWGESNLLDQAVQGAAAPAPPFPRTTWTGALYPAPGRVNFDDNNNYGTGGVKTLIAGTYNEDSIFGPLGISIPAGVHPIDPTGVAVNYFATGNRFSNTFATEERTEAFVLNNTVYSAANNRFGKLRAGRQPNPDNPNRWPSYTNRWEMQADPSVLATMEDQSGVGPWYQGTETPGTLQAYMSNSANNLFLADEPDEIVLEPSFRDNLYDALLSPAEMLYLHLNDTDWGNASTTSRLEELIKFNFERNNFLNTPTITPPIIPDPYDDSWLLRSQFTTDSWDRWEFAFAPAVGTILTDPASPRAWEFSPLQGDQNRLVFPPEFDGANRFTTNDPFRPELRQWLTVELNRTQTFNNFPLPQRRLNINRVLDKDRRGNFVQRHLTPHPVFTAADDDVNGILPLMYSSGDGSLVKIYNTSNAAGSDLASLPGVLAFENMQNDKFVQEWWAKYDRQRMARDIYVLLYTLGAGDHGFDPTQNPYPPTPDENGNNINDHVEAMAQFAVNYVDALDRDGVITEFVYDTNLSNGWNITGEKDSSGDFVDTTGETARVFGVEAQQLTFSESLFAEFSNNQTMDSDLTPWNDTNTEPAIQFLFVELRNMSPFNVKYDRDTWRLRRIPTEGADPSDNDPIIEFAEAGALPYIERGANFWIGTHNLPNETDLPAAILADLDGNEEYNAADVYCPSRELEDPGDPAPICNLDLSHSDHDTFFSDNFDASQNFLTQGGPWTANPGSRYQLILERRLNIHGHGKLDNDSANPWVAVDTMVVEANSAEIDLFNGGTTIDASKLQEVKSIERSQPLARDDDAPFFSVALPDMATRQHSFGPDTPEPFNDAIYDPYVDANQATPEINMAKTFTLWQAHFDRDFTSVYELLSVPIVGPQELTEKIAEGSKLSGLNTAFSKFAIPDPGTGDVNDRNHWYRVLELLEVPTSVQSGIKDKLPIPRTPGKINLNTIRHPGVLAALIDDDYHLGTFPDPGVVISDTDTDKAQYAYRQLQDPKETNRHWLEQFVYSRDRIDPVSNLPLPGIPGSRPFRPLSFVDTNGNLNSRASVEHTLLRSIPYNGSVGAMGENTTPLGSPGTTWGDAGADLETGTQQGLDRRRLFEARTLDDITVDAVDFHTRQRLLNKVANNTTVRSHVFYCWIHVQFHEAAEDEFGNVQVGGKLDDATHPSQRAFFVLDRSKLEEAWDPRTGTFDWRKFVVLRKVLQ